MHVVLLSLAAMLLQQPDVKGFEILEAGLPKGNVTVTCVSRSGLTALVDNGKEFAIVQGDEIVPLKGIAAGGIKVHGIRDDGLMVLQSFHPEPRLVLYKNGESKTYLGFWEPGRQPGAIPSGFGADGAAYAFIGTHVGPESSIVHVRVADGDLVEIGRDSRVPNVARIVDSTDQGFLGEYMVLTSFKQKPGTAVTSMKKMGFAAYMSGNTVTLFETPPGSVGSSILAWSDDGRTVAGMTGPGPGPAPVIWRDGKLLDRFVVKNLPINVWFTALTKNGNMAVGRRMNPKASVALVWQEDKGLRTLAELAAEKKIDIPRDWVMIDALGVTSNGSLITGTAKNTRDHRIRPFRLRIASKDGTKDKDGDQS